MSVHYKFKSALDYDTVTFDGLHISVADLKKAIIQQKRIGKNTDFDLQVTNAQTKEVYNDENALIAKNTSLIIARIPLAAQPNKGRNWNDTNQSGVPIRGNEDGNSQILNKAVDLSRLDASEEDKIRAMMTQSTLDYDPSNYLKIRGQNQVGEVPANYRCYKCHQPGHWIKNCPLGLQQEPVEIKKSTGIPRSFMVPVDGPLVPGAMMTPTGQYAVPALDHQAYNSDGGNRGGVEAEPTPDIPEDLVCSICKDLLTDAVMIPCCGNSFCDECIRTTLLESEDHECPDCHEKDISPATLIPNRFLRNSVSNFKNATGYKKRPQYRPAVNKVIAEQAAAAEPKTNDANGVVGEETSDQKLIISEADSTGAISNDKPKEEVKPKSFPQVEINALTGEIQPKVTSSQTVQNNQKDSRSSQYRPTVTAPQTTVEPTQAYNSTEERPGTPTIDEPGVTPTQHEAPPAYTAEKPDQRSQMVSGYPQTYNQQYPPYGPPVRRPDYQHQRMPYDQVRSQMGPYDPQRPPPNQYGGYPPRHVGPPMNRPYGPPPGMRNPPPGLRPTEVIDDPLAAFERMLREKDERNRRNRESRRSRSRSFSPRSRRSRSSSRSRSYSRSRSPRSRSPPPKQKLRRSRTPRSISRSRSRSRPHMVRRSRSPRSRSFSMSRKTFRSRSYSRSMSPREFSPRRRPISRGRYRSPLRSSPSRYRYQDRRGPGDRGSYHGPPRDRDYGMGYYEGPPPDFVDRRMDRDKDFDRDRSDREGRGRRGAPIRGRGRYLPSPMRKEYPLVPQNQPAFYTVQEHAVYHHQNAPPNSRLPPSVVPGRIGGPPPQVYPPPIMNVKPENYETPAPPGTEQPPVPGLESPTLMEFNSNLIPDAPPGVDPHATDTVLTKPSVEDRPKEVTKERTRESRHRDHHRSSDYKHRRSSHTPSHEKHSKSPHRHRHKYDDKTDKRNKDSSDDEKAKKSKEKKKKRRERVKEKEAEKNRKKEEKKKRKEQEKLDKLKKTEEKKLKAEKDIPKEEEVKEEKKEEVKEEVMDLYGDVLTEGIDTTVVQSYGKLKEEEPKSNTPEREEPEEKEFDGLDLYVNENDILKSDEAKKSKDVLIAPVPVLSKWEVEDEAQNDKKDDETDEYDDENNKVTSEVLKHAENAIFKKAINAIRPIEIKKISGDRAKLYSGEKESSPEKESIAPANIQITIPTNEWGEVRLVDINPNGEPRRTENIPSAVQKPTPPVRLSVRERLGSKVEELDKITKDDRHYDRNRSRTLSPLSKREREETRRVVEVDKHRHRHHNWNSNRSDRKNKVERSRSRDRNYRDHRRNDSRSHHRDHRDRRDDSKKKVETKRRSSTPEHKRKKDKKHRKEKSKRTKKDDEKPEKTETEKETKPETESKKIVERRKPTLDEANFEPDYDLDSQSESEVKKRERSPEGDTPVKKRKVEEKKPKKEIHTSSSDSSSDSSSSEDEKPKKKHKKHKKKKSSKKVSESSSDSDSDSSSDEETKRRKNKSKKHKSGSSSKKVLKKKKKSKHK